MFRGQRPIAVEKPAGRAQAADGTVFEVTAQHVKTERGPGGDGHEHAENTEVADIYVVRHDFDIAGVWEAALIFDGGRGNEVFQILEESPSPMVGQKAIATESPTTDDRVASTRSAHATRSARCTTSRSPTPLEAGKPTVVIFGTPRYCESRTCGPVVDYVESAKKKVSDDAIFIHVEVWKNDKVVGQPKGGRAGVRRVEARHRAVDLLHRRRTARCATAGSAPPARTRSARPSRRSSRPSAAHGRSARPGRAAPSAGRRTPTPARRGR